MTPLIEPGVARTIDQDLFYVESVVSVRDGGKWVADLDILKINFADVDILKPKSERQCLCGDDVQRKLREEVDIVSIDSWDELLDEPNSTGIVRANGNWYARLAAASLLFQRREDSRVAMFPSEDVCLGCEIKDREMGADMLREYEANLPQFCID